MIKSTFLRRTLIVTCTPVLLIASAAVEVGAAIRDAWKQFAIECKSNWEDIYSAAREGWLSPRDLIAMRIREHRKSLSWAITNDPNHLRNKWCRRQYADLIASNPKHKTPQAPAAVSAGEDD